MNKRRIDALFHLTMGALAGGLSGALISICILYAVAIEQIEWPWLLTLIVQNGPVLVTWICVGIVSTLFLILGIIVDWKDLRSEW